jgi:glutamate synthase domain-containing protein 2
MAVDYIYPDHEIVRDYDRCIVCRVCERQCANEAHEYLSESKKMVADNAKCVNCHRCVSLCPTRALKIVKTDHSFKENANWSGKSIKEIYKQAGSGGVLLSSMGNPENYPIYFNKILLNASQVTNPSIDPLREPMETRVYLGAKPGSIERDEKGRLVNNLKPHIKLSMPVMFSAMSYIYSIEDLRQLVYSLKEATGYTKPVIVKIAAVHNVALIASGIARSGADIIAIDGFRGGTGAAPTRIRDHVGIPIELALASVDKRLRDEGIRNNVSIVTGGSIRSSADVVKAVALGADCVYIGTAALIALGCHLCRSCQTGKCNWGIATQRENLVKRLNPDFGYKRLVSLLTAWKHEIKEMMGGMGINSIESLKGLSGKHSDRSICYRYHHHFQCRRSKACADRKRL